MVCLRAAEGAGIYRVGWPMAMELSLLIYYFIRYSHSTM